MTLRLACIGAAFLALASCTDDTEAASTAVVELAPPTSADGNEARGIEVLPLAPQDSGGDDARVRGTAALIAGCALIELDEGLAAVEFPPGSELETPRLVRLSNGESIDFTPGRRVDTGGGVGDAQRGRAQGSAELVTCLDRTGAGLVLFLNGQ